MAMTEKDRSSIVGVFEDEAQADQATNELRTAGFSDDQINVEVHNANVGDENIPADEPGTETQGPTTAGMMQGNVLSRKAQLSRTVVTVQAPGREQEALAILHRNGANNANIPDALEPEIAPALGIETNQSTGQTQPVPDPNAPDDFFSRPGEQGRQAAP